MFLAGQIVGVFVTIAAVISMQFKTMKNILAGQIVANLLLMLNCALLSAWAGAGTGIIATIQTIVNYTFSARGKKIPVLLTIFFMILYVVSSFFTYKVIADSLPLIASLIFAVAVMQEKASVCRLLSLGNSALWLTYDFCIGAYTTTLTHIILLVSVIAAIVRLDIKEWKKK
ncbi:MAG: YgjV family protein [Clostridia bacterium]|nr:YgjV family protein [Clostridia bacterium]